MIKANIFRDYDVRAIVPQELDKKGAIRIGQVLVNLFKPKTVAIGHDMRITADEIAGGIAEGIMIQGANVTDLGIGIFKCLNDFLLAILPCLVLFKNPFCIKNGSITSSTVPISSAMVAERVSKPTGPPA